ncbi:MAG: hypothetical protein ACLR17_08565 [Enterobacteriaceae bacterium]
MTLGSDGGWPIEKNTITLHHDGEFWRRPPAPSCSSSFRYPNPVTMSGLTATLAHDPGRQGRLKFSSTVGGKHNLATDLRYPDATSQRFAGEWGQALVIGDLSAGDYAITVLELCNDDMRIAPVESTYPLKLVSGHDAQTCRVAYQSPVPLASVRLTVDALSSSARKWWLSCTNGLRKNPDNARQSNAAGDPAYRGAPLSDGL